MLRTFTQSLSKSSEKRVVMMMMMMGKKKKTNFYEICRRRFSNEHINPKSGEPVGESPTVRHYTESSFVDSSLLRYYRFSEHLPAMKTQSGILGGAYALGMLGAIYITFYWIDYFTSPVYRVERRLRAWRQSMTNEFAARREWTLRQQISHFICIPDKLDGGKTIPEEVKNEIFDAPTRKQWHKKMTLKTIKNNLQEANIENINMSPLTMSPEEFCYKYDAGNSIKQGYWERWHSRDTVAKLANRYEAKINPKKKDSDSKK